MPKFVQAEQTGPGGFLSGHEWRILEKGWDPAGDVRKGLTFCNEYFHASCSCPAFVSKRSLNVTNRRDEGLPHSEDLSGRAQLGCPSIAMSGSSQAG